MSEHEVPEPATHNPVARPSWFKTLAWCWGLRTEHAAPSGNPTGLIAVLTVLWLALWAVIDWWERQPDPAFAADGIPLLGWYGLAAVALAALLRGRSSPVPPLGATLVLGAGLVPLPLLLVTVIEGTVSPIWFSCACLIAIVYAFVYLLRGLRAVTGRTQRSAAALGVTFIVAFVAVSDKTNAIPDIWDPRETGTLLSDEVLAGRETALFEQADRIDQALEEVTRDTLPRSEAFFLGFAGVGDEKVFAQEIGLASRVIGERYRTSEHQVSLINDERDLSAPLASVSGLGYALQGMASRMKLDRDVLFLAISSHGSPDPAIAVSNSQFPLTDLKPEELADALRESGIKWRVIVISACYAGGFVEPLRDARTIIIAAAARDRMSFGCSSDSDLTYFGEAFYRDALPEAKSLREAFENAKGAIAAREKAQGDEPSNPQAYFGAELEEHLAALEHAGSAL